MQNIEVGTKVEWLGNSYEVIGFKGNGVLLRQLFSIGITLKDSVPLKEVKIVK